MGVVNYKEGDLDAQKLECDNCGEQVDMVVKCPGCEAFCCEQCYDYTSQDVCEECLDNQVEDGDDEEDEPDTK
jgi:hypothetical protein